VPSDKEKGFLQEIESKPPQEKKKLARFEWDRAVVKPQKLDKKAERSFKTRLAKQSEVKTRNVFTKEHSQYKINNRKK